MQPHARCDSPARWQHVPLCTQPSYCLAQVSMQHQSHTTQDNYELFQSFKTSRNNTQLTNISLTRLYTTYVLFRANVLSWFILSKVLCLFIMIIIQHLEWELLGPLFFVLYEHNYDESKYSTWPFVYTSILRRRREANDQQTREKDKVDVLRSIINTRPVGGRSTRVDQVVSVRLSLHWRRMSPPLVRSRRSEDTAFPI